MLLLLVGQIVGIPPINAISENEWPMFRHDPARTGSSTSKAPDTNDILWVIPYAGPPCVISDGKLYTAQFCFNAETSEFIWQRGNLTTDGNTITVIEGMGYSVNNPRYDEKYIICWNASNGNAIWKQELKGNVISSPLVVEGRVYLADHDWIYCLNASTGKLAWEYDTSVLVREYTSPTYSEGKIYVGCYYLGILFCLNALSGELEWKYTSESQIYLSPVVSGGKVYISTWLEKVYCIDAMTGDSLWDYNTNGMAVYSLTSYYDKLYFSSSDCNVYCLNANTGSLLWIFNTGGGVYSSPAIADGKIFFASNDNYFYCLNATTGEEIWRYKNEYPDSYVYSSPIVANGKVYIAFRGRLYCFGRLLNITVDPTFYDNRGKTLIPEPQNWTILLPNEKEITVADRTTINGQIGNYRFSSIVWNGKEVLTYKNSAKSINFLKSDQIWSPRINCTLPTKTSIFLNSTTNIGYKVAITGILSCHKEGVLDADILLLYSINNGETWNEISQVKTDSNGNYYVIWMPVATGNYLVKAIWEGNEIFPSSEGSCNLMVIPYENKFVFPVSSNSTISSLVWDSHDRKLHFNLVGPSNTTGYAQVAIPKILISNKNKIKVYLDDDEISYQIESENDSWILLFKYKHSIHEVVITLGSTPSGWRIPGFFTESTLLGLILGIIIIWFYKKRG